MKKFLIFVSLLAIAASVSAAGQGGASGRVLTPTRNVMTFTGLEKDLIDAIDKHNDDALKKIVAPNFELRSAAAPGVPTPRDDSLKHWMAQGQLQSSIAQMAVHEYGDVMVVSFLWKIAAAKDGAQAQSVFVVDTWKRAEGDWQLMVRYAAPVGAGAEANVPGAVAPSAQSLRKKI